MKAISMSKSLSIGILAVVIPACALDAEGPDGSETDVLVGAELRGSTPDDQSSAAGPETSIDTAALTLASFPTCNAVRNWFDASVPDWNVTGTVDCAMGIGAHSPAVGQLQRSMNVCFREHLVVDDDFGPATQAALKRTQQRSRTKADGVYGPNTRKAMRHESNEVPNTCVPVP